MRDSDEDWMFVYAEALPFQMCPDQIGIRYILIAHEPQPPQLLPQPLPQLLLLLLLLLPQEELPLEPVQLPVQLPELER